MPGWDGLETLTRIMKEHPVPCIILSAYSKREANITLKCLNAGAVGFVLKPSGELSLDIKDIQRELVDEVKAVAAVSLSKLHPLKIKKPKEVKKQTTEGGQIIIIGASTGGPQTLAVILPEIPASFSLPVLVLQHISNLFFTESMSEHLNKQCQLKVKVAENGEAIHAGFIYFAPPGFLTHFRKTQKQVTFQLVETTDDLHRPNIDDTMESAVEIYGDQVIGIILSGMGRDGLQGMQKIKLAGGKTLVQDESSLIFGMSKAVVDAGIADQILPPHKITDAIVSYGESVHA